MLGAEVCHRGMARQGWVVPPPVAHVQKFRRVPRILFIITLFSGVEEDVRKPKQKRKGTNQNNVLEERV